MQRAKDAHANLGHHPIWQAAPAELQAMADNFDGIRQRANAGWPWVVLRNDLLVATTPRTLAILLAIQSATSWLGCAALWLRVGLTMYLCRSFVDTAQRAPGRLGTSRMLPKVIPLVSTGLVCVGKEWLNHTPHGVWPRFVVDVAGLGIGIGFWLRSGPRPGAWWRALANKLTLR